jgi:hypothetical protein
MRKTVYIPEMGQDVTIRVLAPLEMRQVKDRARREAQGDKDGMRYCMVVHSLTLGMVEPEMSQADVVSFMRQNATAAARVATEIIEWSVAEGDSLLSQAPR